MSRNKSFKIEPSLANTARLHAKSQQGGFSAFCKKLLFAYFVEKKVCDQYGRVSPEWAESKERKRGWLKGQNTRGFEITGLKVTEEMANALDNWTTSGNDPEASSISSLFRFLIKKELYCLGYYNKKGEPTKSFEQLRQALGQKEAA